MIAKLYKRVSKWVYQRLYSTGRFRYVRTVGYFLTGLLVLGLVNVPLIQWALRIYEFPLINVAVSALDVVIISVVMGIFWRFKHRIVRVPKIQISAEDITQSILDKRLEMVLQPIYKVSTSTVVGFELLARMHHPLYGMMKPFDYAAAVELAGPHVTQKITEYAVLQAAEFYSLFKQDGRDMQMSVNLRDEDLANPDIISTITKTLTKFNMPLDRLTVEIPQPALRKNTTTALKIIASLDALDVKVCLDNFGTNIMSFMYFKDFLINSIKIDTSITKDTMIDPHNLDVVRAIVHTSHNVGAHVTAKYIETPEALEQMRAVGCDFIQGYIVAPPMTVEQARRWLSTSTQ